jgi:hypothetical protein
MNCSVCGAARDAGDNFCRNCGCRFPHEPCGAMPAAAAGTGEKPTVDMRKYRRTSRRLKILAAAVVAAALCAAVIVQAAPGLFKLAGFKPDDLGVTWTEQDYRDVIAKCGVLCDEPPAGTDKSKVQNVYTGSKDVDWSFTEREVTALLNGGTKPGYWPVSGIQVRIHGDNVLEAACMLDPAKLMTYPAVKRFLPKEVVSYISGIPLQLPVRVKAKITCAGPKQADITILSLEASGMSMAGMVVNDQANQIVESIVNEMLAEAGPVSIQSFTTGEGTMRVQGTWYQELRRIPAE